MLVVDEQGMPALQRSIGAVVAALLALTAACSSVEPQTADQVMTHLTGKVLTAKLGVVYTAADDPHHLLGRPNSYTSRVSFSDSRADPTLLEGPRPDAIDAGGSIEVYADADGAQTDAQYIQNLQKSAPILGSEYSYLDGPVLARVSGKLTPVQAAAYEAALNDWRMATGRGCSEGWRSGGRAPDGTTGGLVPSVLGQDLPGIPSISITLSAWQQGPSRGRFSRLVSTEP